MCSVGVRCAAVPAWALSSWIASSELSRPGTTVPLLDFNTGIVLVNHGVYGRGPFLAETLIRALYTLTARLSTPRRTPSLYVIVVSVFRVPCT